jgi:hypothetical protein
MKQIYFARNIGMNAFFSNTIFAHFCSLFAFGRLRMEKAQKDRKVYIARFNF